MALELSAALYVFFQSWILLIIDIYNIIIQYKKEQKQQVRGKCVISPVFTIHLGGNKPQQCDHLSDYYYY